MKKNVGIKNGLFPLICLLCVLVLGLLEKTADASIVPSATVPELIQAADIICVGTASNIQVQGKAMFDTGGYVDGKPCQELADKAIADFSVEDVIKGKLTTRTIKITFPKNIWGAYVTGPFFTEMRTGQRIIVFLKSGSDKTTLALLGPINYPSTQIPIGKTSLKSASTELTPLRKMLLYLAQALTEQDPSVRSDCLQRIQDTGLLLNIPEDTSGLHYYLSIGKHIRADIGEPPTSKLEEFVHGRILPSVVSLLASPDPVTRDNALLTAAALQDVQVIPDLVKLATAQDQNFSNAAASAIGAYRVPEAERLLVPLLKDNVGVIREQAASALMEYADPLTLPFLIDCLGDSDETVLNHVTVALFEITDEHPPAGTITTLNYIAFWKNWAAQHRDKIKSLRVQFDAGSAPHRL